MIYSKYANEWLIGFHKKFGHMEDDAVRGWIDDQYIARKLVDSRNDGYMRPVWEALIKRADDQKETGIWFYSRCQRAYAWDSGERKTRLEKKRELLAISKKARELAELVGGYGEKIDLKKLWVEGGKDKCKEVLEDRLSGSKKTSYWAERAANSAVQSVLYEHNNPRSGEEWLPESEYAPFGYPGLDLILTRLSSNLTDEATVPPQTAKPNADNAHLIVFVRKLTASMQDRFGQPLRAVVANTTCVLFDAEDIDDEFVRSNTRN